MLTQQAHTPFSTTVPQEQQKPALLLTYPHLVALLIYLIRLWYASFLARPIFGGDDFALPLSALARPIFAPDDETEEHHPRQGAPANQSRDKILQSQPPRQAGTVTAGQRSQPAEPTVPIAARATFGRDDDEEHHPTKRAGEPLDTPIKAGEPTAPIHSLLLAAEGGDGSGWSLLFGPKDNGGPGFLFGPKDGGEPGWSITLFAPEDPTVDSPIKCQTRLLLIDDDDEDRYPSFGDDDELGGWYRSRLPGSAKPSGGGASLLTTPSGYPLNISLMGGDGRRPLFDDEKPDDDGWYHPRPCFPLTARPGGRGPIWPTEPPDADRSPVFPLPAYPAGSTAVIPVAQHYQQLQEALRWQ